MAKSKKRLIDADKFVKNLQDFGNNVHAIMPDIQNNMPYFAHTGNPMTDAVREEINAAFGQFTVTISDTIRQVIWAISVIAEEAIYEDHPCALCRDSELDQEE